MGKTKKRPANYVFASAEITLRDMIASAPNAELFIPGRGKVIPKNWRRGDDLPLRLSIKNDVIAVEAVVTDRRGTVPYPRGMGSVMLDELPRLLDFIESRPLTEWTFDKMEEARKQLYLNRQIGFVTPQKEYDKVYGIPAR